MALPNQNKRKYPTLNNNVLEALRGISQGVGKAVTHDVIAKTGDNIFNSLTESSPVQSETLIPEQSNNTFEKYPRYSAFSPERSSHQPIKMEETGLNQKIESVRQELAALVKSVTQLNKEIEKTVTEIPVQPGIYHLNFFERIRSILRLVRENIDDSRSWLSMSTSRKSKRKYWGMYKKHGTTFGLSQERTLATQAG
jgi:hypothetical protein